MNIPNALTCLRVALIGVFWWVYETKPGTDPRWSPWMIMLVIFIVASLTDMLDGMLARKMNCITSFGKIADPLADKLLTFSAFAAVLLVTKSVLGLIFVLIILAREIAVTVMRVVALRKNIVIPAGFPGKIKTAVQMVSLVICMSFIYCNEKYCSFATSGDVSIVTATNVFIGLSAALAAWSGAYYFIHAKKLFAENKVPAGKSKKH